MHLLILFVYRVVVPTGQDWEHMNIQEDSCKIDQHQTIKLHNTAEMACTVLEIDYWGYTFLYMQIIENICYLPVVAPLTSHSVLNVYSLRRTLIWPHFYYSDITGMMHTVHILLFLSEIIIMLIYMRNYILRPLSMTCFWRIWALAWALIQYKDAIFPV